MNSSVHIQTSYYQPIPTNSSQTHTEAAFGSFHFLKKLARTILITPFTSGAHLAFDLVEIANP